MRGISAAVCRLRVFFAVGLGAAGVAGCAVDQGEEVATYRAVLDEGMPAVVTPEIDEASTLQKPLLVANKSNEQLSIQGRGVPAVADRQVRAFSAFLPTVSVGPSESFSHVRGIRTTRPRWSAGGDERVQRVPGLELAQAARP